MEEDEEMQEGSGGVASEDDEDLEGGDEDDDDEDVDKQEEDAEGIDGEEDGEGEVQPGPRLSSPIGQSETAILVAAVLGVKPLADLSVTLNPSVVNMRSAMEGEEEDTKKAAVSMAVCKGSGEMNI